MYKYLIRFNVFILNCIYIIFKMLPTNRNKIFFLSRQSNKPSIDFRKLMGNLNENYDVKMVVMTKRVEKNLKDVLTKNVLISFRQMYHLATSKVCIVDGYNITVSVLKHKKSLKIFQIWHSLGAIKKFGYQSLVTEKQKVIAKEMSMHKNYDYILSASQETTNYLQKSFSYKKDKFIIGTLPRVDYLKEHSQINKNKIYQKYPNFKNKKIVLYAPTFRPNNNYKIKEVIEKFNNKDYILILKLHPNIKEKYQSNNNVYLCNEFSTLQLLSVANYVITDYSGLSLEASVLNKQIYIFAYDYDDYKKNPGINIDLKKEFKKYFFTDIDDLYNSIGNRYNKKIIRDYCNKYIEIQKDVTNKLVDEIVVRGFEYED